MGFELFLLCALIFVFLISFCGLIQKIKQSYERERLIADALLRRRQGAASVNRRIPLSDDCDYTNRGFLPDGDSGIFPSAPPPYTQIYPPPKYDDAIKQDIPQVVVVTPTSGERRQSAPPPYTISVS